MMRAFSIPPAETKDTNIKINAIFNSKHEPQWVIIQETDEGRVLFLVNDPNGDQQSALEVPEKHASDRVD